MLLCLQELPDTVFGVGAGARTLDATNNKLTTVSPQLAQLSNLSRLVLTSNQIQELPAAVLQLQSLKVGISAVWHCWHLQAAVVALQWRVGSRAWCGRLLSSRLRS